MAKVTVTLSDEMKGFLEGLYESQKKLALAAEHIEAAAEALSKLGLKQDDIAAIIAARAGVSKTAVLRIMATLRRRDLDAYEILAMYISAKENIGREPARKVLKALMDVITQVEGAGQTALATLERSAGA